MFGLQTRGRNGNQNSAAAEYSDTQWGHCTCTICMPNLSKQVQSAHPTPPFSLIVDIIIIYALMTYPVVRKLNYEPMNLASHRECYFVAAAS